MTYIEEEEFRDGQEENFKIYAEGLFYSSVCSSLSEGETVRRMQSLPSGTTRGYILSGDKTFASGEPNPTPCNETPKTHKHYLFEV